MKILIASTNPGKINEISAILNTNKNIEIQTIADMNIQEPDEPFDTFMDNARHKAKYYATITGEVTLSEDAGLCIEALDGLLGVRTKDFITECGGLSNSFKKLEELLTGDNFNAYFICAAVLYMPASDIYITHEEIDRGVISFPPRGEHGFGLDPIFIPNGYNKTMAELGPIVKNTIGHRALAVRGILEKLN